MHPFKPLAYGGDWNPEQWDDATISEDLRLMKSAHVNLVTLGVFSWALTEPQEGVYDFAWLASIMDRCADAGIGVDLATGTASPPAWMAYNHPETLPIDRDGRTLQFGSRQHYSPAHPYVRAKARALAEALARALGSHPALKMWHIGNEYGCHVHESFDPTSIAEFRAWLRERYGSIDALNAAWCTSFWSQRYADFDQIGGPAPLPTFPNPTHVRDWRHFFSDQLRAAYEAEAEVLRRLTPHIPLTTNFMGLFAPADYWQWSRRVDVVADDSYPDPASPYAAHEVACTGDLMRSLAGDKPFVLMEQTSSAVQWRTHNCAKRPGQNRLWSLSRVGHGADGILYFQWRQSVGGAETFHSAMVPHTGPRGPVWDSVCTLGEDLTSLADIAGTRPHNRVAVLLDWNAQWAGEALISRSPHDHFLQVKRWHRAFWEGGYGVDFVSTDSPLTDYAVIVVPGLVALPADAHGFSERLREAASRGSQVILAAPTGLVDHHIHALAGYGGPLAELAGVSVSDYDAQVPTLTQPWLDEPVSERTDRLTSTVNVPARSRRIDITCETTGPLAEAARAAGLPDGWCTGQGTFDLMQPACDGVEIVARYAASGVAADHAGAPAITRRACGEGAVWWIGTVLDTDARAVLAVLAAAHAGVEPAGGEPLPAGVECVERGGYVFYLNHSDHEISLTGVVEHANAPVGAEHTRGRDLVLPARTGVVLTR